MKIRVYILYALFFSGALLFFAVVRFPHDRASLMMSAFFETLLPGATVHVDRTAFVFPAGLKLINTDIEWKGRFHVRPDRLVVSVHLLSLLRSEKQVHITADINEGQIKGTVTSADLLMPPFSERTFSLTGVKISGFDYVNQTSDIAMSFTARGQFSYSDAYSPGTGQMALSDVTVRINHPVLKQMGIFPVEFDHVAIDFHLDPHGLSVEQFSAKGPAMNMTLKGDIIPEDRFDNSAPGSSLISFKGYMQPSASHLPKFASVPKLVMLFKAVHEKGIPIHITGTMDHPGITL